MSQDKKEAFNESTVKRLEDSISTRTMTDEEKARLRELFSEWLNPSEPRKIYRLVGSAGLKFIEEMMEEGSELMTKKKF